MSRRRLVAAMAPLAFLTVLTFLTFLAGCGSPEKVSGEPLVATSSVPPSPSASPSVSPSVSPSASSSLSPSAVTVPSVDVPPVPTMAPPTGVTEEPVSVYYANCTEAKRAGAAPLHRGEPGYRKALDRDGDGVACET